MKGQGILLLLLALVFHQISNFIRHRPHFAQRRVKEELEGSSDLDIINGSNNKKFVPAFTARGESERESGWSAVVCEIKEGIVCNLCHFKQSAD